MRNTRLTIIMLHEPRWMPESLQGYRIFTDCDPWFRYGHHHAMAVSNQHVPQRTSSDARPRGRLESTNTTLTRRSSTYPYVHCQDAGRLQKENKREKFVARQPPYCTISDGNATSSPSSNTNPDLPDTTSHAPDNPSRLLNSTLWDVSAVILSLARGDKRSGLGNPRIRMALLTRSSQ